MNEFIQILLNRKSIRAYKDQPISQEEKDVILHAALRAPTAGNMTLYSIIEVTDQKIKDTLARTCDNQPFIARAPLVLLFLADYQRWYDYYHYAGVEQLCAQKSELMLKPEEGDLFLACCDALISAQTAVIAAESLCVGSCYIGDIMENFEEHRQLFNLPRYVFPICLLCFGYPTQQQLRGPLTSRFDPKFIVFENQYHRLAPDEFREMFAAENQRLSVNAPDTSSIHNIGQTMYYRKFAAQFSKEMRRSVRVILQNWSKE